MIVTAIYLAYVIMCYTIFTQYQHVGYTRELARHRQLSRYTSKCLTLQGLKHGHATVEEMKAALKLEMGNKGMAGMARCFWILAYSINISQ